MEKREINSLRGGICTCMGNCGCLYEGPQCPSGDSYYGGSSREDNSSANGYNLVMSLSV